MGLNPRPERRARIAGRHRQPRPRRAVPSPDPAAPPTWRAWKAQNGGKRWHRRAPLAIEWAFEWVNHGLHRWAFVEFLEYAGRFTILVVAVFWFLEADDRAKERHYRAWELINAARGSTGDGGRRDALQDLNSDGVSLAAAPLEQAWLPGVDLESADLGGANLHGANLQRANLKGADLWGTNLEGANLKEANLEGATLWFANLKGADLWFANLRGADLWFANLQDSKLQGANLEGGDLWNANLQGADLRIANLKGAALEASPGAIDREMLKATLRLAYEITIPLKNLTIRAKLKRAALGGANPERVRDLAQQQLDAADGDDRTVLPDGLTRPAHWTKTEGDEAPPAPQPDGAGQPPAPAVAGGSDK